MESFSSLASLFPDDFRFGVATSAYQIEGSVDADGRGPSIWDHFATKPGTIERGESAAVACDHYRRRDDDVELMRSLGLDSYRFSIAWPRVQPSGRGAANAAGLGFYDQLIDRLLDAGVIPFPTLFHWDLPQALQESGGWAARDTAERYADYAAIVVDRLGDRVKEWALFNEPYIFTSRGYLLGRYAPGHRSLREFLRSVHTVTRAHALGYRAIKAVKPDALVGSVFAMAPCEPATNSPDDRHAATFADAIFNHLFLDPLLVGRYPQTFLDGVPVPAMEIADGDMDHVRTPLDFVGVNCYYRLVLSAEGNVADLPFMLFGMRADQRSSGGHADFTEPDDAVGQMRRHACRCMCVRADARSPTNLMPTDTFSISHASRITVRICIRWPKRSRPAPTCAAITPGACTTTSSGHRDIGHDSDWCASITKRSSAR